MVITMNCLNSLKIIKNKIKSQIFQQSHLMFRKKTCSPTQSPVMLKIANNDLLLPFQLV
jgi:hypothetical protein